MMRICKQLLGRLNKWYLRPIRVFCFHQVSDVFDPKGMWECDWTQTDVFKKKILALERKYTFISLEEAYSYIVNDKIRWKNYAVLTADDGWASLKNIIPWLAEKKIPVTLFLNPLYMDGVHRQSRETESFLTTEDVDSLVERFYPYITIASHGWSHDDCVKMTFERFKESVVKSEEYLGLMNAKVSFYAFTFGRCTCKHMEFLEQNGLTPVLVDGMKNYNDLSCIHRECIDENNLINI
jgi:peptidoglycan/xylan/chitin deacetylase (PgdA/CDA1 family)